MNGEPVVYDPATDTLLVELQALAVRVAGRGQR